VLRSRRLVRGWKAFRLDRQGQLRFLFHAHKGTTVVPVGAWLEAKARWVSDAGRPYRSGFHFFRKWDDVLNFHRQTKEKYVVMTVLVAKVRPKPRTIAGSWIARYLYVPKRRR